MTRFRTYSSFLILLFLLISCAAKNNTASTRHIPPPLPETVQQNTVSFLSQPDLADKRKIIVQHALKSLGFPYKWGGRSPQTGFDCSGLIVYTHEKANISIPRTAEAQYLKGKILPQKKLQAADLVFFENPETGKAFHVGIYIGDGLFVHAPGRHRQVTYSNLSNPYFKKHYIGSRSYL